MLKGVIGLVALGCFAALSGGASYAQPVPEVAVKLQQLQQQKIIRNWSFDPVNTSVLGKDLRFITGARVPANFRQHVIEQNARAAAQPPETGTSARATNTCFSNLASFDWRQHGGLTPVRDQGSCGSCWVFGAHGALEGNWLISNDAPIDSSEQNTLDCDSNDCGGGWPSDALDYLTRTGSATEASYPYTGVRGACQVPPTKLSYWARNWGYVSDDDTIPSVAKLKTALCHYGPSAVGVIVTDAFQSYGTDQVFNEHAGGDINHIVTLVGWDDQKRAWLIKNSWGTGWGTSAGYGTERGYMWIAYNSNKIGYGAIWTQARLVTPPGPAPATQVSGLVHLQRLGDQPLLDARWAGTIGQSRRLEGFSVDFASPVPGLGLEYMCHVQDSGDQPWMSGGSFCGTRGLEKRLEGLAINLTGPNASKYDVFYACHIQDLGDVGPVKNGVYCGTRGLSKRLEAMEVWVAQRSEFPITLNGVVHLQDIGDQPLSDGVWAGTKGQRRRLEGFSVDFAPPVPGLGLEYMCHVQDSGDQPWMSGGSFCGTRGREKRLEGFAIRLTGPNSSEYKVSYSCHVQDKGDIGPFENGAYCGTRGKEKRVEAMLVSVTKTMP